MKLITETIIIERSNSMPNRRASSVIFGFDFQINAAIVLAFENIINLESIKIESDYEDIDISLINNSHILAQAKSIIDPINDFTNIRKNIKKSLQSLSEGSQKLENEQKVCSSLIYITNSRNPLKQNEYRTTDFSGKTKKNYNDLSHDAKNKIDQIISDNNIKIDKNLFTVYLLPFETDDRAERYKEIIRVIDDFLGKNEIYIPYLSNDILTKWTTLFLHNGSTDDVKIILRKNDLLWPIINLITHPKKLGPVFRDNFDDDEYQVIISNYYQLIEETTERVESFTKVIFDFANYSSSSGTANQKILNFAEEFYQNYIKEFLLDELPIETQKNLAKVIIYCILTKRSIIKSLKEGVSHANNRT